MLPNHWHQRAAFSSPQQPPVCSRSSWVQSSWGRTRGKILSSRRFSPGWGQVSEHRGPISLLSTKTKALHSQWPVFIIKDWLLYRRWPGREGKATSNILQLLLPACVIEFSNWSMGPWWAGHFGVSKTLHRSRLWLARLSAGHQKARSSMWRLLHEEEARPTLSRLAPAVPGGGIYGEGGGIYGVGGGIYGAGGCGHACPASPSRTGVSTTSWWPRTICGVTETVVVYRCPAGRLEKDSARPLRPAGSLSGPWLALSARSGGTGGTIFALLPSPPDSGTHPILTSSLHHWETVLQAWSSLQRGYVTCSEPLCVCLLFWVHVEWYVCARVLCEYVVEGLFIFLLQV